MNVSVAIGALALFAWYLSWIAGRVDHLNRRTRIAHAALLANLDERARTLLAFAESAGLNDVCEVAREALRPDEDTQRAFRESAVTSAIWAISGSADAATLAPVIESARRAQLSRRFHADAVRATQVMRSRRLVRWFGLAGHSSMPVTIDFADDLPPGV